MLRCGASRATAPWEQRNLHIERIAEIGRQAWQKETGDRQQARVEGNELREFARQELKLGRETYLRRRALHYRLGGKRRWSLECRRKTAYVWQRGRFEGDEDFWRDRLGESASVKPVKSGSALSFNLHTKSDFDAFRQAATEQLKDREWHVSSMAHDDEIDGDIEVE
jgi:hypothetical protein